jgi:hypothetical protein
MRANAWLWVISFVLMLVMGAWQRVSGPTYPISGTAAVGGSRFAYRLERTHAGPGDHLVEVPMQPGMAGTLEWREHAATPAAAGAWIPVPMAALPSRPVLAAAIPHHAAAQKVDYRVTLRAAGATATLPAPGTATLRFRSEVPAWVLIPHIIAMMGALMLAVRAALECFRREPVLRFLTLRTTSALFLGGFPLGCAVSAYAFGQPWGGFPLGNDATDNKTLIAFVAWLVASVAVFRTRNPRVIVVGAALIMFLVYLVPHSFTLPR